MWGAVSRPKLTLQETPFILGRVELQRTFPSTPPPAVLRTCFVAGSRWEEKESFSAGSAASYWDPFCICHPSAHWTACHSVARVFQMFVSYSVTRVEGVYLFGLGEGVIDEWLIKAHCCHIPGCLGHLPNNVHHSFTQPPHFLAAGRGPCDTGRTL